MLPRIYLCWFPQASIAQINPIQTLNQLISRANQRAADALAKSMRLNWIVQDIQTNNMLKPIVVDNHWQTIVGDTRLMAANLLSWSTVPLLAQLDSPQAQIIESPQDLLTHCGVSNAITHGADFFQQPVEWVDFDIAESRHHWHNQTQRLGIMHAYLDSQPTDFVFTSDWYLTPIDWTHWSR